MVRRFWFPGGVGYVVTNAVSNADVIVGCCLLRCLVGGWRVEMGC